MLSPQLLVFAFAIVPPLVSAALFSRDSMVEMIDAKGFKKAMKENQTSVVAFVAPWCGHCQKMVPELSKAALGLYPLVPVYAVDCDAEKNKRFCAEQDVQGFPTIKLFPRGNTMPPVLYDFGERTASGFWYFATRKIPRAFTKIYQDHELAPWVEKHQSKHRALLLRKDKKVPLLWQVLANKYQGQLEFGERRDRKGRTSVKMGLEAGEKTESKVLLYPAGSTDFVRYHGVKKLDSLSKFLDSVLNGTADLSTIVEETKAEELVIGEEELEIERKQEAQRIALLHGGYNNLIDFEKALMEGAGADYHDSHGYGGIMGGIPEHLKKKPSGATASATTEAATTTEPSPLSEDETEKPVAAPESIKAPEDKKINTENRPPKGEQLAEQVIFEAGKNHANKAESTPLGRQCKGQQKKSDLTKDEL